VSPGEGARLVREPPIGVISSHATGLAVGDRIKGAARIGDEERNCETFQGAKGA